MAKPFDEADFERLLDQYGTDSSAWPPAAEQSAEELLASSHQAREALAQAQLLDDALDAALAPPPTPLGLRTRILAGAQRGNAAWRWLTAKAWRPAGAACAPLLLGFALGVAFGVDGIASQEETAGSEPNLLLALSDDDLADFELPAFDINGDVE